MLRTNHLKSVLVLLATTLLAVPVLALARTPEYSDYWRGRQDGRRVLCELKTRDAAAPSSDCCSSSSSFVVHRSSFSALWLLPVTISGRLGRPGLLGVPDTGNLGQFLNGCCGSSTCGSCVAGALPNLIRGSSGRRGNRLQAQAADLIGRSPDYVAGYVEEFENR